MGKRFKTGGTLFYGALRSLIKNNGSEMAGHLTFLSLLSLFPYMVLIFSVLGAFGQGETGRHLIDIALQHLPQEAVSAVQPRIVEIISGPPTGLLTLAALGALWTSSSAVGSIRSVLNRAYDVTNPRAYLMDRLIAIAEVLAFTLIILIVMLVMVFTPLVMQGFTAITGIPIPLTLEHLLTHYFIYIGALTLIGMVAALYYYLPNLRQRWADVLPGAVLVVALWISGATITSFYLTRISQLTPIYGSLSSLIGTMIFFYVMISIFIFGAEFNHELLKLRGKRAIEKKPAVEAEPEAPAV